MYCIGDVDDGCLSSFNKPFEVVYSSSHQYRLPTCLVFLLAHQVCMKEYIQLIFFSKFDVFLHDLLLFSELAKPN